MRHFQPSPSAPWTLLSALILLVGVVPAMAAEFGHAGGPPIINTGEVIGALQKEPYDLELMLSFGTSKFGSGGHIALAVRDLDQERVYSANFYADRTESHQKDRFTRDLMCVIPKAEYLFGSTSTLSEKASFGLDFGEIFKRSVIGIRVAGVPASEKDALVAFFKRLNADYEQDLPSTDYHERRILYGYMDLNCAKTVAAAFKFGAGYKDLKIKGTSVLSKVVPVRALKANIPMEVAMKLTALWAKRGYRLDTVLYKKYTGSTYADPHDEVPVMFRDLPNRFPSVLSLDYAGDETEYEDYDNLYAMNLVVNLSRHTVTLDGDARTLVLESSHQPLTFAQASSRAADDAGRDSKLLVRRLFHSWGVRLGMANDNSKLYRFEAGQAPESLEP